LYWNRALQIDPWCVLAIEGLLETSVEPPTDVVHTVLSTMTPTSCRNNTPAGENKSENDDAEWLRALYLARVCTAAPNAANAPSSSASATATGSTMTGSTGPGSGSGSGGSGGVDIGNDKDDPMEDDNENDEDNMYHDTNDNDDDGNGDENMGQGRATSFS